MCRNYESDDEAEISSELEEDFIEEYNDEVMLDILSYRFRERNHDWFEFLKLVLRHYGNDLPPRPLAIEVNNFNIFAINEYERWELQIDMGVPLEQILPQLRTYDRPIPALESRPKNIFFILGVLYSYLK